MEICAKGWVIAGLILSLVGTVLIVFSCWSKTPGGRAFNTSAHPTMFSIGLISLALGFAFQIVGTIFF